MNILGGIMDYYHGSSIMGLSELKPYASPTSNLQNPVVYLTTSKQLALHYIWDDKRVGTKWPMLHIRDDGVLVFQEMFSGALEFLYKGLKGCIYRCVGDYDIDPNSGVLTCSTSKNIVPVVDYEAVDDVYEKILDYERKGTFIYDKFEERPLSVHNRIREIIINQIKRVDLFNNPTHAYYDFFQSKFPEYWHEAEELYKNNNL